MARGREGEVEAKVEQEAGRLEARSEVEVENMKDKGMRFIASELGLNLSLNLNYPSPVTFISLTLRFIFFHER